MSAQCYTSSLRTTHAGFQNEDDEYERVPYAKLEEQVPDSNPDEPHKVV